MVFAAKIELMALPHQALLWLIHSESTHADFDRYNDPDGLTSWIGKS